MVETWLRYGRSEIPARVPEERLLEILIPNKDPQISEPLQETKRLIQTNDRLQEVVRNAKSICIVLGPMHSRELAANLIKTCLETSYGENQEHPQTVLLTPDAPELASSDLSNVRVLRHNPTSSPTLPITTYRTDFPVDVNADFLNADLRILIGDLRPHHFLRETGLSDVVFPGLASEASIQGHLSNRPNLVASDLNRERIEIASSLENTYAIGFVTDVDETPTGIVAGPLADCLAKLENHMDRIFSREAMKAADIVVMSAGGAPTDETLLRAVETFPAGLAVLKKNGVLIVAAECSRGHGNTEFYEWAAEHKESRYLEARLRHKFSYNGFKASFLVRALQSHRVYLVSTIPDHYVEHVFGMKAAPTVNAALQTAQRIQGSDSKISVIPDASRVLPKLRESPKPAE